MGRVQRATVRAALLIGAASVAGVLLREAVTVGFRRTGASRLAAVPPSLGANLLGSFALGGMHSAGDYAAPCVRAGLSTGFAGALTTFATAMFHAGFLLVRGRVGRAVTSALLTVLASAAAYVAGVDLFSMFELSCKLSVDNEVTATVLCAVVQVVAWLAVVLAAALDPSAGRRSRWLAAAFAPPGAVLRWMLARLNKEDMPRGTFLANMLASLIDCILASLLYRRVGGTRASVWFSAMFTGFAGSLSTISTFVGELRALPSGKRLAYAIFSVCVAQFLFLVIYGVVVWTS